MDLQLRIQDFLFEERRAIGGGEHRPPTQVLFGENVCENKRIGSCWGGAPAAPPGSANDLGSKYTMHRAWKVSLNGRMLRLKDDYAYSPYFRATS